MVWCEKIRSKNSNMNMAGSDGEGGIVVSEGVIGPILFSLINDYI